MPYATPTQYTAKFGLEEAVQFLADEQNLLTAQLLRDAINGTWTGSPSQAEKDAATESLARLLRQLTNSSNFIDGYLRAVVTLPLAPDAAAAGTLEDCCLALTRCGLADDPDNATERMDRCCDTWRTWLKDIAARRVQLVVGGDSGEVPPASGGVRAGKARSGFAWGAFGKVNSQ